MQGIPLAKRFCSCSVSKSRDDHQIFSCREPSLRCKFVEVLCLFSDIFFKCSSLSVLWVIGIG